jgi:hypothetical protein
MNLFKSQAVCAGAAVLLLAVYPQEAQSARKRIELMSEPCYYMLTFDPKKADEARIRNTFELLVPPDEATSWLVSFSYPVFSAGEIKTIDPESVARQCAESLGKLRSLELLRLAGVESQRGVAIAELEDSCGYHRLNAAGYRNPSVLRQYTPAAQCFRFVDALEGKTDLTAMFDEIHRGRCEDNANPKLCRADLQKKRGNAEEMKVDVLNFGWNNCALGFTLRNTSKNAETKRKLGQAFLKTYKAREVNCQAD